MVWPLLDKGTAGGPPSSQQSRGRRQGCTFPRPHRSEVGRLPCSRGCAPGRGSAQTRGRVPSSQDLSLSHRPHVARTFPSYPASLCQKSFHPNRLLSNPSLSPQISPHFQVTSHFQVEGKQTSPAPSSSFPTLPLPLQRGQSGKGGGRAGVHTAVSPLLPWLSLW